MSLSKRSSHKQTDKDSYIESVEEVIAVLFILHEELQVLEDAFLDIDTVVVADTVLAEEVKLYHELFVFILLMKFDMFNAQRTAAHCVGLVLIFLIAST